MSTADDMAKWMNFHLSKGRGPGGETIIAESTMAELYKPRTAMTSSTMTKFRQPDVPVTLSYDVYSMGWRRGYYRGEYVDLCNANFVVDVIDCECVCVSNRWICFKVI